MSVPLRFSTLLFPTNSPMAPEFRQRNDISPYGNQSIYLHLNSFGWFLHDRNKDFQRANSSQIKAEFVHLSWKLILIETNFALLF